MVVYLLCELLQNDEKWLLYEWNGQQYNVLKEL